MKPNIKVVRSTSYPHRYFVFLCYQYITKEIAVDVRAGRIVPVEGAAGSFSEGQIMEIKQKINKIESNERTAKENYGKGKPVKGENAR